MFSVNLRHAEHIRHYSVLPIKRVGWEVTLEEDLEVKRRVRYDDWHRVERAMTAMRLEIVQLTAKGWRRF